MKAGSRDVTCAHVQLMHIFRIFGQTCAEYRLQETCSINYQVQHAPLLAARLRHHHEIDHQWQQIRSHLAQAIPCALSPCSCHGRPCDEGKAGGTPCIAACSETTYHRVCVESHHLRQQRGGRLAGCRRSPAREAQTGGLRWLHAE